MREKGEKLIYVARRHRYGVASGKKAYNENEQTSLIHPWVLAFFPQISCEPRPEQRVLGQLVGAKLNGSV